MSTEQAATVSADAGDEYFTDEASDDGSMPSADIDFDLDDALLAGDSEDEEVEGDEDGEEEGDVDMEGEGDSDEEDDVDADDSDEDGPADEDDDVAEGEAADGSDSDASSASSDDSAEDTVAAAAAGGAKRQSALARHRAELAKLRESDPDFYRFMSKNGAELLAFGEDQDSDEEEGEGEGEGEESGSDTDGEEAPAAGGKPKQAAAGARKGKAAAAVESEDEEGEEEEGDDDDDEEAGSVIPDDDAAAGGDASDGGPPVLTDALLASLASSALDSHSFKGLARLLHAYRAAVHMGDAPGSVGAALGLLAPPPKHRGKKGGKKGGDDEEEAAGPTLTLRYRVTSSAVFMTTVVTTLRRAHAAFAHHLGPRRPGAHGVEAASPAAAAPGPAPRVPLSEYTGWAKLAPLARSLLASTLHLLSHATAPSLRAFLLRCLGAYIPYLAPFVPLTRKYVRALLGLFGGSGGDGDDDEEGTKGAATASAEDAAAAAATNPQALRLTAYLRLRQMASALPSPTLDGVLRGLYLTYVKAAKFMTERSAPGVLVMANCVTEAYGMDEGAAYSHAFVYIRQLALHLRTALTTRAKPALATVCSWQFINCLRLWTQVLCRYAPDASRPLFPLTFPLVQVITGAARLVPTPRFFPLRLHCAAQLAELAWATRLYIPVAPLLLELLTSPALARKPTAAAPGHGNAVDLRLMVRVGSSSLATRAVTDALVNRALDLLLDALKASYVSVALPELAVPVLAGLRAFAKATRVGTWRGRARAIADGLAAQATKVASRRAALSASPGDKAVVAAFMRAEGDALRAERAKARAAAAAKALAEAEEAAAKARAAVAALAADEAGKAAKKKARRVRKAKPEAGEEGSDEGDEDDGSDEDDSEVEGSDSEGEDGGDGSDSDAEGEEGSEDEAPAAPAAGKKRAASGSRQQPAPKKRARAAHAQAGGEDVVEDLDPDML